MLSAGACVVAAIVVATGFATTRGQRRASPPGPETIAQLRAKTVDWASQNDEPRPGGGRVVATTRNSFYGGNVDSDQPVYVVQVHGRFVGYRFPTPRGKPLRRGTVLVLVYDAQTLEITDWELQPADHDLSAYGDVVSLDR